MPDHLSHSDSPSAGRFGLHHHVTRLANQREWRAYVLPPLDSSGRWLTFFKREDGTWLYVLSADERGAVGVALERNR